MPETLVEFTKQTTTRLLKELPIEKRLEGRSSEDCLKGLSPEDPEALLRLLMTKDDSTKP